MKTSLVTRNRPDARVARERGRKASARCLGVLFSVVAILSTAEAQVSPWSLASTTGPSGRVETAMAYDSTRGVVVLFGGRLSNYTAFGDTWEWDGVSWTQVATSGPSPRHTAAMAFDARRGVSVLFGAWGFDSTTWEWDGTTWTPVALAGPPARYYPLMVYDPVRQVVVLHGGYPASGGALPYTDTWEYDGVAWRPIPAAGPKIGHVNAYGHSMAFDSTAGRMRLVAHHSTPRRYSYFEYDGTQWSWLPNIEVSQSRVIEDSARGRMLRFDNSDVLYEWENGSWRGIRPPVAPSVHIGGLAYDSTRARIVLFGGNGETWEYGDPRLGTATSFGQGCGQPPLELVSLVTPVIGVWGDAATTYYSGISWMTWLIGASDTNAHGVPLPVSLDFLGWTGCSLLQSSDVVLVGGQVVRVNVPLDTALLGAHVYVQGLTNDPNAPGGIILSNGLDWTIGNA